MNPVVFSRAKHRQPVGWDCFVVCLAQIERVPSSRLDKFASLITSSLNLKKKTFKTAVEDSLNNLKLDIAKFLVIYKFKNGE